MIFLSSICELGSQKRISLGRAAITLAMTEDRDEEESCKKLLSAQGYKVVATEVSGQLMEAQQKIIKNTVTAAVNTKLISNDRRQIHSINHAVLEAMQGVVTASNAPNPSLKLKIAVVTDNEWVAVGMFGYSALYFSTNQEKCGLGIMSL